MIAMSSLLPVPIMFYNKDKLHKYLIEQIDKKEKDTENDDIIEIT